MGLNLKINRIIFSNIRKFNSSKKEHSILSDSELKQIAGRAGRSDSVGFVSALYMKDLDYVKEIMKKSISKRSEKRLVEEITLRKLNQ
jgi:superfamily II RNA helicase